MEITLPAEFWIKFCTYLTDVLSPQILLSVLLLFLQIGKTINFFHFSGNSSLLQIELISLWMSEPIVLPPALVKCTGICSISDYL
jgi:hypothetical protein